MANRTPCFHFLLQDQLYSYSYRSFSNLIVDIDRILVKPIRSEIFIEKSPDTEILQFIPDYISLCAEGPDLIFQQYEKDFVKFEPNEPSSPYKISFRPFSKPQIYLSHFSYILLLDDKTLQHNSLCVDWNPCLFKLNSGFFKVYSGSKPPMEDQKFASVDFVEIQNVNNVLIKFTQLYLRTPNGQWKEINSNFLYENRFNVIVDEGSTPIQLPINTFNEIWKVVPDEYDKGVLASSFTKELLTTDYKQKSMILNYLIGMTELYTLLPQFYAPFVTICQSSGTGKSRLILECGTDIPLIYGVFRATTDTGYPEMSQWTKNFIAFVKGGKMDHVPKVKNIRSFRAGIYSMGRVLIFIDALMKAYKIMFEQFVSQGKSTTEALKEINSKFYSPVGQMEFANEVEMCKVELEIENLTFDEVFNSIKGIAGYFKDKLADIVKDAPFVIVFDELSLLLNVEFSGHLNLFHIIRRALHLLPKETDFGILIVGIGTNGDVSLFHKQVTDDSLRSVDRFLFLPSFILGNNWDIFKSFINLNSFKLTLKNVRNTKMIKLLCSFGRPLWSSLSFMSLITLAKTKLLNGSSNNFNSSLAIWSIRTGLSLNSDMVLARTLLRSYMAIAFSISYDSELMNIGYPSEPILAMAARDFINSPDSDFNFESLLEILFEFVQTRPIDKGEVTEAIFTQIILLAIENSENVAEKTNYPMFVDSENVNLKCIFNSNTFLLESVKSKFAQNVIHSTDSARSSFEAYYHITTVESFLKTLYGNVKGELISEELSPSLRNGIINASHTINVLRNFPYEKVYDEKDADATNIKIPAADNNNLGNNVIDQAILRNLFIRQALLKPPNCYYGLDLCIPVLLNRNTHANVEEEGIFGYIGLQFKSNYESEASVIPKMDPTIHYVQCVHHENCDENCNYRTKVEDLRFIFENHLLLYMSADYIEEISPVNEDAKTGRKARLIANEKIVKTVVEEKFSVKRYLTFPCVITRSISELSFLDNRCRELIKRIIHSQSDPFKSADKFQSRMVAGNVLSMSPLSYHEADNDLRSTRGLIALPDPFLANQNKWLNVAEIKSFIEKKMRLIVPKKKMENMENMDLL